MKYKCIKSLSKSTYNGNAFTKNKKYEVFKEEENKYISFLDNELKEFHFCKDGIDYTMYSLNDYMVLVK